MNIIYEKMLEATNFNDMVFPGATYVFMHNNEIESNVVGKRALYPEVVDNTIDTLYDLASLTKVVSTNVIIAKLLEENRIKLSDKVKKYWSEFEYDDITIYHLLTHSSGLGADLNWKELENRTDIINKIIAKKKEYETGSMAIYSDIGFIILGFIIEKITGKPLEQCAKEMVFEPLEMIDTGYLPTDIERCAPTELQDGVYTRGVVHDEKTKLLNGVAGSAGIFSTISDISKFIQMILDNGLYKGRRFLNKETIDLWFTKEKPTAVGSWRSIGWVCGSTSSICSSTSEDTIFHGGYTGGRILIDRENKLAIAYLSNRVHPSRNNQRISDFTVELYKLVYDNYIKIKEMVL